MVFKYCPKCGEQCGEKEIGDEGLVPFCASCNKVLFSFSYPCVLCLVFDEDDNVVLQKWDENSNYGGVAGFIKEGEPAEDAAKREVEEEVGLIVDELKYVKSYGYSDRLMLGFFCKTKKAELRISEKEVYSAGWFLASEAQNLVRQGSVIKQLLDEYINQRTA